MSEFTINYPVLGGEQETRTIKSGQIMFLVGANGTGKSTLMHHFASQNPGKVKRITAHRQVWLSSNSVDLTCSVFPC